AAGGEDAVVDVDVFGAHRRIGEGGIAVRQRSGRVVVVLGGIGPALAQHVQRGHQVHLLAVLATAAADQLDPAGVDVVGLFVVALRADGVPAVAPGEGGYAVLQCQHLALLRIVQLRQRLVPAGVDVAALPAKAHAGAAVGAVAQAGGVDVALGRSEPDRHRYAAVVS